MFHYSLHHCSASWHACQVDRGVMPRGVTFGGLSAHGGVPNCPVVGSNPRWGQSIDLAHWCRDWPGVVPARRRRPRLGASWRRSRSQASRTSAWMPETSMRARACSCSRAMCARSGGTAASLSSCRRLVALKPPVIVRRQRCCWRSRVSPIQCRMALIVRSNNGYCSTSVHVRTYWSNCPLIFTLIH